MIWRRSIVVLQRGSGLAAGYELPTFNPRRRIIFSRIQWTNQPSLGRNSWAPAGHVGCRTIYLGVNYGLPISLAGDENDGIELFFKIIINLQIAHSKFRSHFEETPQLLPLLLYITGGVDLEWPPRSHLFSPPLVVIGLLAEVNLFDLLPNRVRWCSVLFSDQSESGMILVCWILFLACQCLIVFFVVKSLICLDFMTLGIGCMLMILFLRIFLVCCSSFDVLLASTCVLRFMIFSYKIWLVC